MVRIQFTPCTVHGAHLPETLMMRIALGVVGGDDANVAPQLNVAF